MNRLGALLLVAGLGMWSLAQAKEECVPGTGVQMSGAADAPWTIQIQLGPDGAPLNTPFDADIIVCTQSQQYPARIAVDATMPAHKHGMNYEPATVKIDSGHYEARNLLFHMPGVWRFEVTAYENDKPHRYTHDVSVQ